MSKESGSDEAMVDVAEVAEEVVESTVYQQVSVGGKPNVSPSMAPCDANTSQTNPPNVQPVPVNQQAVIAALDEIVEDDEAFADQLVPSAPFPAETQNTPFYPPHNHSSHPPKFLYFKTASLASM